MTTLRIADAPLVGAVTKDLKIPVGNAGGAPLAMSVEQLYSYLRDTSRTQCLQFNGNGNFLCFLDDRCLNVGGGDFTVEAFLKLLAPPGTAMGLFDTGPAGAGGSFGGMNVFVSNGGNMFWGYAAASGFYGGPPPAQGSWFHLAVSRAGNVFRMFLNGVQKGTLTSASVVNDSLASHYFGLGGYNQSALNGLPSANWFNGRLSNFRYVVGHAVYTAPFTPPTVPLTAVPGTALLIGSEIRDLSPNNIVLGGPSLPALVLDTPFP